MVTIFTFSVFLAIVSIMAPRTLLLGHLSIFVFLVRFWSRPDPHFSLKLVYKNHVFCFATRRLWVRVIVIGQGAKTNKRENEEMEFHFFVLSRCTSRQNEEMEFHFFVCLFCCVSQGAKANKRENEISKFHFFVCSFCRVVQVVKTKNGFHFFVFSYCRLPHSTTERQNHKVTAKYQSLICRGYLFVLSFVRFVDFQKAPKRQNDNATKWGFAVISFCRLFVLSRYTSRQNEEMKFHFGVCSFCP